MKVEIPLKLKGAFESNKLYIAMYGGRGSGKSASACQIILIKGIQRSRRILCCREIQKSTKQSVLAELKQWIDKLDLHWAYSYGENYIKSKINDTEFIFAGLKHNISSIKSTAGIDLVFVEEAETVSEESWRNLFPTFIRNEGAECIIVWNPEREDAPVKKRFIDMPPSSCITVEINYKDNPWFNEAMDELRREDKARMDPDMYAHVWEGKTITRSDAQIFSERYKVVDFDRKEILAAAQASGGGPYLGADFGFSADPSTILKVCIVGKTLYILEEGYRAGVEIVDFKKFYEETITDVGLYMVRADSSRPEVISHIRNDGLQFESVTKWPGSIEDGVSYLKGFESIVVHSDCTNTAEEFRLYSYKVDRLSGDILPDIVDKHNHCMDALRYALQPMIKTGGGVFIGGKRVA